MNNRLVLTPLEIAAEMKQFIGFKKPERLLKFLETSEKVNKH
jgi:hypothetical protein